MSFAIEFDRSSMMTATEPRMCEGPLREKVLKWMREADMDGAVAMRMKPSWACALAIWFAVV